MGVLRPRHSRPGCHEDEPLGYVCEARGIGVTHMPDNLAKSELLKDLVSSYSKSGERGVIRNHVSPRPASGLAPLRKRVLRQAFTLEPFRRFPCLQVLYVRLIRGEIN